MYVTHCRYEVRIINTEIHKRLTISVDRKYASISNREKGQPDEREDSVSRFGDNRITLDCSVYAEYTVSLSINVCLLPF